MVGIVSFQDVSGDQSLETVIDVFFIFHNQIEHKKGFLPSALMRTSLANNFVVDDTSEMIFKEIVVLCSFYLLFDAVHESIEELVGVHLFKDIGRIPLKVLEGVAELRRTMMQFVAELKT